MNNVLKLLLGVTLAVAGGFFLAGSSGQKSALAQVVGTYSADWQASKLFAIQTQNLPVEFNNTSPRDLFAYGVAEWKVDFYEGTGQGRTLMARETWTTPTPNCYQYGIPEFPAPESPCAPGQSNAGAYLYGIVSEYKMRPYRRMTIEKVNVDDSRLYLSQGTNPRFAGPGAVAETNQDDNIDGFYSTGAYSWWAGKFGEAGRDAEMAGGIMLPLKWTVTGELY